MTRLWMSGFHSNATTASLEFSSVSGTASIQSSVIRTGPYAARFNPTATTGFMRFHGFAANQSTIGYQAFYLRIATLPGANTTICRFVDISNNPCAQLRLTATGTLILLDASGATVGSASSALSTNTWYLIELGLDAAATPGTVTGRVNGTQFASGNNSANSPWARWLVGPVVSATCDLYVADWRVNNSSGSVNNSWPGEGVVLALAPNAAGDNSSWNNTANTAGDANNYQLVDDISPPNDATDYVQSLAATARDSYEVAGTGIGNGTVNCVMVGGRYANNPSADAATVFKFELKKTAGGTIAQSSAIVPNSTTWVTNANAEPRNYPIVAETDPDGLPWTISTVESMLVGLQLTTTGTNRVRVSAVYGLVDITPSAATASPPPALIKRLQPLLVR